MTFEITAQAAELRDRVKVFMASHVYPMEDQWEALLEARSDRWQPVPMMEELK